MNRRSTIIILTEKTFARQVAENTKPVLVLFCARWSGSSDIMVPILEELAHEFSGQVAFAKIDIDKYSEIPMKFGIESVPTLIFFNHGRVVDRQTGVISKSELADRLRALLQKSKK